MDKIEICNLALSRIGVDNVISLTEASESARACLQFYDHCRRVVLRKYPWTWATRRVQLAELSDKPIDWEHSYRYPAKCACLRKLYNAEGTNVPEYTGYVIGADSSGRVIWTNVKCSIAEYTADVEDSTLFDEQFAEALSWKLAAAVAFKLTGNAQLSQMAEQQYNALFLDAAANNDDEQNAPRREPYTLIAARFGGSIRDGEY